MKKLILIALVAGLGIYVLQRSKTQDQKFAAISALSWAAAQEDWYHKNAPLFGENTGSSVSPKGKMGDYFWGCRRLGLNFCPFSEGF